MNRLSPEIVRMLRRVAILAVCLLSVLLVSCQTPYSLALGGTLTGNGTSGVTSVTLTELPATLAVSGTYTVESGRLTVVVIAPDASRPFEETYVQGASGTIDQELTPAIGEWVLQVTSDDAVGSYELRLNY